MKNRLKHPSFSRFLALLLTLSVGGIVITLSHVRAQAPASVTSSSDRVALYQALIDLTNPWTVMCVAAHPDDEDGTTLTVLRHKYGVRTVSLFSTFGEGGQNAIGPELYEELGAIRERETRAAAEIQGSEPYFLGLTDFGFSKSADEAFRVWGHDEALRRMILQIRKLRPDVIITNHDTTSGHGHHQATGRLVLEAFDAAADPTRFPEQLRDGVTTWQVQRLFVRFGFGAATEQRSGEGVVTIDPNERDPIRNTIFAEQALNALQKHATQGPWPKTLAEMAARFRNSTDGKVPMINYRLMREAKGAAPLPRDSHYVLEGLRLPEVARALWQPPRIDGRPLTDFVDDRERVSKALLEVQNEALRAAGGPTAGDGERIVASDARSRRAIARFRKAMAVAAGISSTLRPRGGVLVPGTSATFVLAVANHGASKVTLEFPTLTVHDEASHVSAMRPAGNAFQATIEPGKTVEVPFSYTVPRNARLSTPHFKHLYDGFGSGESFFASIFVGINGVSFDLSDSTLADVGTQVEIESITPSPVVVASSRNDGTGAKKPVSISISLHNNEAEPFTGTLMASQPGAQPERVAIHLPGLGSEVLKVPVLLPAASTTPGKRAGDASIVFSVTDSKSVRIISETVPLVRADARMAPTAHVAYIRGFDYSLANALDALGVVPKELTVEDVRTGDLKGYDTIIVDNRAYELVPGLIPVNQRLLDFAKDGGTLIVFYHKSNEWNPNPRLNRSQLSPYPITLGNERVTDEDAAVSFLAADHPLLNVPNKIGPEDFKGWIQERGLYYPRDWDSHYTALFAMNDPGESQLRGGLLAADYGRGHYIYTSMVWYRQLRAGIPGAYRMLANMISYGHGQK